MTLKEMLVCHETNRKSINAVKKELNHLESERLKLAIDLRDRNYSDNRGMGMSRFYHILRTAGIKSPYDKDYKRGE